MICPKCGNKDDGEFCSNCGAVLIPEDPQVNVQKKKSAVLLISILVLLAVIGSAFWFIFQSNDSAGKGGFSGSDREGVSDTGLAINESIYSRNGVSVEALSIDSIDGKNFILTLMITNNSNKDMNVEIESIAVNGYEFNTYDWIHVAKKSTVVHDCNSYDFSGFDYLKVSVVDNLDINLSVTSDDYDRVDELPLTKINFFEDHDFTINDKGYSVGDEDFEVIYDDDKISIKLIEAGKSVYSDYVVVYVVENKTDSEITCNISTVYVNGIETTASAYLDISANTSAIEKMWIWDEEYGDEFRIKMDFTAYDYNSTIIVAEGTTEESQ